MIIQRLFSRKTSHDKYHPVLHDYNYDVNIKEDNPEFDKHLKKKVKGDKISRRVYQIGLPASIGAVVGATVKGGHPMKKVALGAGVGAGLAGAAGYGVGKAVDKITKFDEKQENARSKVSEGYKKLGYRGYKGQNEREKYRSKYLDPSKNLKDIK
jgi:hypothetical protein